MRSHQHYIIHLFNQLHKLLLNMFKFGEHQVSNDQYEIAEFTNERLSVLQLDLSLTLITLGGRDAPPPLDISLKYSATRKALAATLYDNFLSSFLHILTHNLWCLGVRFHSYVTFCRCMSDRKRLNNVLLCTKSMQIDFFFHSIHIIWLFLLSMAEIDLF